MSWVTSSNFKYVHCFQVYLVPEFQARLTCPGHHIFIHYNHLVASTAQDMQMQGAENYSYRILAMKVGMPRKAHAPQELDVLSLHKYEYKI